MVAPALTWKQVLAFGPCDPAPIRRLLKATYPDYKKRAFTLADAATAGVDFDSLIWIAGRASDVDPDCARRIRLFGADCAAGVAHIATDPRSTAAIVAARQFARGEIDAEQLATARAAARAAAWGAVWDTARRDAARAAALDAAAAACAAARDAARDAALDAARAATSATAWDAEQKWQTYRLIEWFSDNEPSDWPMTNTHEITDRQRVLYDMDAYVGEVDDPVTEEADVLAVE